ncbi:FecCD family ABC transporter permease [Paenibacillus sediminis]|uniref:Iron complex transport system permease protein n=1 Tax=Paenibacillus sediminis TaxID=664909 RepID=A0ABS4H520_9BACL|nr:iron ABC transporter permease [Paenibacillus sediminis]MBP1937180.1 iron complex transport system permease protein [Paenibacillus sediminis]
MSSIKRNNSVASRGSLRTITTISILFVLIVISFIISMNTGIVRLSPIDVFKTLFGSGTPRQELILFDFRLPRIVISILVGAGLAVSGAILQATFRNELADPGILGINSGASLAVVLFITFFPLNELSPIFMLPFIALLGGSLAAVLINILAYKKGYGISPSRLIITGIAVTSGISAALLMLTVRLDPRNFEFVTIWLSGSIWGTNWKFVLALLPWILILLPFVYFKARTIDVMNLGDYIAAGLGTSVGRDRLVLMGTAVALAGSCIAVGGGISFIGLIAPHIARRLVGPLYRALIPTSALIGGLLLIVADTLARVILQPAEVPTGIVVSMIGAPYFLYLLARARA